MFQIWLNIMKQKSLVLAKKKKQQYLSKFIVLSSNETLLHLPSPSLFIYKLKFFFSISASLFLYLLDEEPMTRTIQACIHLIWSHSVLWLFVCLLICLYLHHWNLSWYTYLHPLMHHNLRSGFLSEDLMLHIWVASKKRRRKNSTWK